MTRSAIFMRLAAGGALLVMLGGASLPRALAGPGQWEVGRKAVGPGERMCLPDPALLLQWEHRRQSCTRVVLQSSLDRAEVEYQCVGGGFGTSRMQVLTPRSIKVETQGIADGLPFAYVIHARRIGECSAPAHPPGHQSSRR